MSEQDNMDRALASALAAPKPTLSRGFDKQLHRRLHPAPLTTAGRCLLIAYAVIAVLLSVWVMRQASIEWPFVAVAVLAPLVLAAAIQFATSWVRLSSRTGK